jgi:hypothetical protein
MQVEWVKQLSSDPNNLILAIARDPDNATALKPFVGPQVVPIKGDIADIESFPVRQKQKYLTIDLLSNHPINEGNYKRNRKDWAGKS